MGKRSDFRNILITGASSGIGEALAHALAGPDSFLALSGRNAGRLHRVATDVEERGSVVDAKLVDVQDRQATADWIHRTDARNPLDLVVANAGISGGTGALGGESEDQVRDIFAVNLAGVLNTVLPAVSLMKQRGRGQIAIISSLAGFRGMPSAPAYSASKAAVKAYGEALRGELHEDGIGVSVVCPGFVKSRITDRNEFRMPFLMEADDAARIIVRGLERNRARISFPWPMHAAVWLLAALPPAWTDPFLRKAPKKT